MANMSYYLDDATDWQPYNQGSSYELPEGGGMSQPTSQWYSPSLNAITPYDPATGKDASGLYQANTPEWYDQKNGAGSYDASVKEYAGQIGTQDPRKFFRAMWESGAAKAAEQAAPREERDLGLVKLGLALMAGGAGAGAAGIGAGAAEAGLGSAVADIGVGGAAADAVGASLAGGSGGVGSGALAAMKAAGDPIEALIVMSEQTGGLPATQAAQALGFSSPEAALQAAGFGGQVAVPGSVGGISNDVRQLLGIPQSVGLPGSPSLTGMPSVPPGATSAVNAVTRSDSGPSAASAPPQGIQKAGEGTNFVQSIIEQLKKNALPLGAMALAAGAGAGSAKTPLPNQAAYEGMAGNAAGLSQQLIDQYRTGTLSPAQQAGLSQHIQNAKNQINNYFASIRQSDSTAHMQALAQVDQTALAMKQQILDTALQSGLSAMGAAQGPLNTIAQYQLGQDRTLSEAFGNFAKGVGMMMGTTAGTPTPMKTP